MSRPIRPWFRLASAPRGPSPALEPEQVRPSPTEPVFTPLSPSPILQIQPIRDPVPPLPAVTQPAPQLPQQPLEKSYFGSTTTTFETTKPEPQTPLFYEPIKPKHDALVPPAIVSREPESKIPLESEQKTVLYQKTVESEGYKDSDKPVKYVFNGSGRDEFRKDGDHQDRHHKPKNEILSKKTLDSDDQTLGRKIITLAGENKGAFMEVTRTPKRQEDQAHVFYKNGHRLGEDLIGGENKNELEKGVKSDHEGGRKGEKMKGINGVPVTSFTNSNVQGVNNSIMFNASCTHHDPGVHLVLSRKPNGEGFKVKEHISDHEAARHS